jgi:Holliday junction resolvasome RuvABC DNA-binding subunit
MKGLVAYDLLQLLNHADVKQLKKLHLIGPKRAELIVAMRAQHTFAEVRCSPFFLPSSLRLPRPPLLTYLPTLRCVQLSDLRQIGMSEKQVGDFLRKNVIGELFHDAKK